MATILDIGRDLARARRAHGISQRELGQRLGTTQQQVARWEATGYRAASLERVAAAAAALGVAAEPAAAEAPGTYVSAGTGVDAPVRDLGEIAARIRANGETFRGRYHFDRIGVFGSFASGEQAPDSDVDLLVETDDPGGLRFVEAAEFSEALLGRHVDICRPDLLKERLRERVLRETVYVWHA